MRSEKKNLSDAVGPIAQTVLTPDQLLLIVESQAALAEVGFNLELFMAAVVERMQRLTRATGAVVELVEGEEMVYRAASGSVAPFVGLRLARRGSLSGLCVTRGEILVSEDTSCDPRVDAQACKRVGAGSMVVVPLLQKLNAVGVLKVLSTRPHAFNAGDIQILANMAGILGSLLGQQIAIAAHAASEDLSRDRSGSFELIAKRVTHDLNNYLAVVRIYADLIVDEAPARSSPHYQASKIATACEQAAKAVEQIGAFADFRPAQGETLHNGERHAMRGRERVLLVDDNVDLADGLAAALSNLGYEVAPVYASLEALSIMQEEPSAWDVIVTDQRMPGLEGLALLREVKKFCPAIKVILYSGFHELLPDEIALPGGADGFLAKPVSAGQIATMIRRLCGPAN